jgi:Rrf2 family protein
MFRITRKADYAVFILSYLARRAAAGGEESLVSAQELSSFSALNKSLVANLLKDLTRAGFLGSVRGARGGYRLDRAPSDISLGEILRAVEGPFSFVECAGNGRDAAEVQTHLPDPSGNGDADPCCNLSGLCASKSALRILHQRIAHLLEELRLDELACLRESGTTVGESVAREAALAAVGATRGGPDPEARTTDPSAGYAPPVDSSSGP